MYFNFFKVKQMIIIITEYAEYALYIYIYIYIYTVGSYINLTKTSEVTVIYRSRGIFSSRSILTIWASELGLQPNMPNM